MGMIIVANTKGGAGKTTVAMHLIAPWVFSRTGSAHVIEIDDQNLEAGSYESSDVVVERFTMGEDAVSHFSAEKVIEKSYAGTVIVDVGGNRTCDTFLRSIGRAGADEDIDLVVVPVSGSGIDVDNARRTVDIIREQLPDYDGKIVLVITRSPTVEKEYVEREVPDAYEFAESYGLAGPLALPQSRLFSGARELGLTAWEVGNRFDRLKEDIRKDKSAAKKRRDLDTARLLARLNAIIMEGQRWHGYLNDQLELLDGIMPLGNGEAGDTKSSAGQPLTEDDARSE